MAWDNRRLDADYVHQIPLAVRSIPLIDEEASSTKSAASPWFSYGNRINKVPFFERSDLWPFPRHLPNTPIFV